MATKGDLLTHGNPKTAKGEKHGYLTAILHLAPSDLAGRHTGRRINICPMATAGCRAACLNTAGRGGLGLDANGLNTVQLARIARTLRYTDERPAFMARLVHEITLHVARARRARLRPAVRLNGTSDIRYELIPVERNGRTHPHIFAAFPRVQFYDYTKLPNRNIAGIPNYHLTYSAADGNERHVARAFRNGLSVAVVVRDPARPTAKTIHPPAIYQGRPMVDGDHTDLRFKDPAGVWVALRAKGRACTDRTGFVRELAGIAT